MANLFYEQLEHGWEWQYDKGFKEGKEEGKREQLVISVAKIANKLGLTVEKAMDILDIPKEERLYYIGMLEVLPDIIDKE